MKTRMAAVLLVLLSTAFFAMAQNPTSLIVSVPFPFYVTGKLLPAGSYRIEPSANLGEITVSSSEGKGGAMAAVITRLSSSSEDKDSVVFDVTGNDHYLSEIYIQGEDGFLVKGSSEKHTHMRVKAKK